MSERKGPRRGGKVDRTREAVAREAASLMLREGVKQYLEAKRVAARRVLGHDGARFRPGALPTNAEIRAELLTLVSLAEGSDRTERLFAMRVVALQVLRELAPWHARLIGSVWSGHARRGSDIDVHVFGDRDALTRELGARGWTTTEEEVLIRVPGGFRVYHHLHVTDRPFPVELSIYELSERREVTRSSIDGKPVDRVSAARLEQRLREEHGPAFAAWEEEGVLSFEEGPEPGAFDALLAQLDDG